MRKLGAMAPFAFAARLAAGARLAPAGWLAVPARLAAAGWLAVAGSLAAPGWLAAAGLCWAGAAYAETTVTVLATEPSGDVVSLRRNETFYLRIGYETDEPVRIWARPYFQGRAVDAGSNPSATYTGSGEALGWFFLIDPDARVDEVRISAGDGTDAGTEIVAVYPVQVRGSASPATREPKPAWVEELKARADAAERAAYEQQTSEPSSPGDTLLLAVFMLAVCVLGLLGIAAPAWALWRWRGGWRVVAAVPAAMMAFVVMRIGLGVSLDPTSHNLWPFEILEAALLSAAIVGLSTVVRKITGARRA
ncbi:MAG TPA: hypothetical protein VFV10_13480 [Gammaproteobacteria bacterium]|nr:hypothetical protein [Gammaproteobacteria bacterium]